MTLETEPKTLTPTTKPGGDKPVQQTATVQAAADDFDEELTLPETTESLNRMGMDTISCVGCQ